MISVGLAGFASCCFLLAVCPGKLIHFSGPQLPRLQMEIMIPTP